MHILRAVGIAAIAVVAAVVVGQTWINGHTVDLVVVNESGTPVEIAWQAAPGAATSSELTPGCSSMSLPISRGASWHVSQDGQVLLDSASAGLPVLDALVAVEVWLDADGSTRIIPARSIARLIDAPYPSCSPTTQGE